MRKTGFKLVVSLLLSTLAFAYAAESDKSEKKKSPYDNCGWNCLGWVWSDQTLKNTIVPLENVSESMEQLKAYSYTWNESGETSLGLIAQNVEQADPRLVRTTESGLKQIYVPGVVALLLAEVKALRAEVNTLKAQQGNNL
ncbi:tail fiber domain-containing protein [Chitinimonas sp. PSY-7]|uniref:tail fiber domain-containing protein n=1 Tax=Chitinimonas sp. PSY-7 TaxID=3459088 RepID=UPI00403FE916